MSKTFKPILAPNDEPNLNEIKYPVMASYKLDGCRIIFREGQTFTRSLKQVQNKQLRDKFEPIRKFSEIKEGTLDGELYTDEIPFQFVVSCFMTKDYDTKSSKKNWDELCKKHKTYITREEVLSKLKFYCFDGLGTDPETTFQQRLTSMVLDVQARPELEELVVPLPHVWLHSKEQVEKMFLEALDNGHEGLILRDPFGRYKYGRGTIKEGLIYKVKPWVTVDAKIIDVEQSTVVDPNAEKTINELGRSVTSKKKEDRILIEKASGYVVKYEDTTVTVPLGKHTDEEKEAVWANREAMIGRHIEYKFMQIGMMDAPRIPKFIRYREDKD